MGCRVRSARTKGGGQLKLPQVGAARFHNIAHIGGAPVRCQPDARLIVQTFVVDDGFSGNAVHLLAAQEHHLLLPPQDNSAQRGNGGLSDKLRGAHGPDWLDNVTILIHRRLQRPGNLFDVGHVHLGFQADHRKPGERLLQQRELAAACRAAEHDETLAIQGPHKRAHLLHWKLDDCHWQ